MILKKYFVLWSDAYIAFHLTFYFLKLETEVVIPEFLFGWVE